MDRAVDAGPRSGARRAPIAGLTVEVHELPGRTPVIVCEVPATDRRRWPTTPSCSTATSTSSRR